jgi:hypothetical protein
MHLLDGFAMETSSSPSDGGFESSLEVVIMGPHTYMQRWELQREDEGFQATGIHNVWPIYWRPTLFKTGFMKVGDICTYAVVQEESTTTRSIQERFLARGLGSVYMVLSEFGSADT